MKLFLLYLTVGLEKNPLLPLGLVQAEALDEAISKTGLIPNGKVPPYPFSGKYLTDQFGALYFLLELREINSPADLFPPPLNT